MSGPIVLPILNAAPLRLFCVPHAGGGAAAFREWGQWLQGVADVVPIELPGRGRRFGEPAAQEIWVLAHEVATAIRGLDPKPFALFGHSMGALVAFEAARILSEAGRVPVCFFPSAHGAPHCPRHDHLLHHRLSDEELWESLKKLDGIPVGLEADTDLRSVMLPVIRADLHAYHRYQYQPGPPLACPIISLGGRYDILVESTELEAWSLHSMAACRTRLFPDGHFFGAEILRQMIRLVASDLSDAACQARRPQFNATCDKNPW